MRLTAPRPTKTYPSSPWTRGARTGRKFLAALLLVLLSTAGVAAAVADEPAPPPPPPKAGDDVEVEVKVAPHPDGNERVFIVRGKDDKGEPIVKWISAKGAFLGVHLTDLTSDLRQHFGVPEDAGVMIGKVVEDSPAMAAGLQVGDIVSSVDGEPVEGAWDLQRAIVQREKGDVVQLEVWRDERVQTVEATLEVRERPKLELSNMQVFIPELPELEGLENDAMRKALHAYKMAVPLQEEKLEQMMKGLEKALEKSGLQKELLQQQKEREHEMERKLQELERKLQELERKLQDD